MGHVVDKLGSGLQIPAGFGMIGEVVEQNVCLRIRLQCTVGEQILYRGILHKAQACQVNRDPQPHGISWRCQMTLPGNQLIDKHAVHIGLKTHLGQDICQWWIG